MSKKIIHPRLDKEIIEIKSKVSVFLFIPNEKYSINEYGTEFDAFCWIKMEIKWKKYRWEYDENFNNKKLNP